MGGGVGPQTITFTLLVNLEDLDEFSEQEIRDQILNLLEELGAGIVEFEPFSPSPPHGSLNVLYRPAQDLIRDSQNGGIYRNIFEKTFTYEAGYGTCWSKP